MKWKGDQRKHNHTEKMRDIIALKGHTKGRDKEDPPRERGKEERGQKTEAVPRRRRRRSISINQDITQTTRF